MAFTDASARAALRQVFEAAIASADPRQVLARHLPERPRGRVIVLGAGKSAAVMAAAVEAAWPRRPDRRLGCDPLCPWLPNAADQGA